VSFISVGIDHEHAPLDLLERATVVELEWGRVLAALLANKNINEAVFVSTCLRTEVYATIELFHGAVDEIVATLAVATGVSSDELQPHLTIHFDRGVPNHLFQVAAGLKSVVPGEHEVLGQLRRALERADEEHAVGPNLAELFRRSLSTGRRVRSETAIARGSTSFAQATVHMAENELGDSLIGARAVIVGAGQLASGVLRSLRDSKFALGEIIIVNRTLERAEELASGVDDSRVSVTALENIGAAVQGARLIVTAIEATDTVLREHHFEEKTTEVLIMDLAMPRVVDVSVDDLPGVERRDISHLGVIVNKTLADRHTLVDEALGIVEQEVEKFHHDMRSRGAAAIVMELRDHLEMLREKEVERRLADLSDLSEEQRERVVSLTRSLVAKIAHAPTLALKDASGTDRGQRLSEATRNLFDL